MNTCWKCQSPLRVETARFCTLCGAAQKPDELAAAQDWQLRINRIEQPPPWGLSLLWLIAWPLSPLTYPVFLTRANRRLKQHVKRRLEAPALAAPRFTQSAEGQQIVNRLARSAGKLTARGVFPAVLSYLLLAVIAILLFIAPTATPRPFHWDDGVEAVFTVSGLRESYYVDSPQSYEAAWKRAASRRYSRAVVTSNWRGPLPQIGKPPSSLWIDADVDTPYRHRPYEFVTTPHYGGGNYEVHQASGITLYWDGTIVAGVFFWIAVGLLFVLYTIGGLTFWFRFTRHAEAEALTAAYARGDVAYHDALLPRVRRRNTLFNIWILLLSVIPFPPLHVILFPALRDGLFARHHAWERRSGVAEGIGING